VDCADVTRPRGILVENVTDLRKWELYPVWRLALETLGYHLTELTVTASRHGVPQRRTRLFIVGTRKPSARSFIEFDDAATRHVPEPPFGPHIDWHSGDWRPVSRAMPGAQTRIARAVSNHGPRCLTQHVTGHPGVPLGEPIRTITTQDQWAVVDGDQYRPITIREAARGMGFPEDYRWPERASRSDQIKGLGNAVSPPPARKMIQRLAEVAL
jgi:DNA (cytosine-5)-methyltransferase 1